MINAMENQNMHAALHMHGRSLRSDSNRLLKFRNLETNLGNS